MEKEYWQVHQHNASVECPEEDEHDHGGYQLIEDDVAGNGLNSDDEEEKQEEEQQEGKEEEEQKCSPSVLKDQCTEESKTANPQENAELGELVEVQPS